MDFDKAIELARALRNAGYTGTLSWAGDDPRTATVEVPIVGALTLADLERLAEVVDPAGGEIDVEVRHGHIKLTSGTT